MAAKQDKREGLLKTRRSDDKMETGVLFSNGRQAKSWKTTEIKTQKQEPSIHPPIYLYIHLIIHPPIHHPSITHLSFHSSPHPFNLYMHPFTHPFLIYYSSIHHLPISHPSTYPSTHSSIHPSIHLSHHRNRDSLNSWMNHCVNWWTLFIYRWVNCYDFHYLELFYRPFVKERCSVCDQTPKTNKIQFQPLYLVSTRNV